METIRVCLIGAGRAGMVHGINLSKHVSGARVVAVVDERDESRRQAASELGADAHFPTLSQALESVSFEAVVIATPTFAHRALAVEAAEAGKHVFCEKPLALTGEDALAMIRATQKAGVLLQVGFMRRFDEDFVGAKALIEAGEIGEPMLIRSTTRGPGLPPPWAWDTSKSNGMLAEVNSHDFDSVRWLIGSEYARVFAQAKARKAGEPRRLHPDFYDVAVVSIELEDGTLGTIDGACPSDYGYDARVEVLGSRGMLTIGEVHDGTLLHVTKDGRGTRRAFRSWRDRFRTGYLNEITEFVECIRKGIAPRVTGVDGLRALEAVLASVRSLTSGRPEPVVRHAV
ncbi:MAG: Gfo/Idh/MocA family oxidoreductase [Firmicutes bacterium]|nr:Gfo/Idh/MocA family oxidoreductase [Bacillota bacterium]